MVEFACVQQGCRATFSTRDLLNTHVQNHQLGKQYCHPCGKFYSDRKHLSTPTHKEKVAIASHMEGILLL